MPSTSEQIRSRATDLEQIDDPELNIATGIKHDRAMWVCWAGAATPFDRRRFMFASYNAGLITILRAQRTARRRHLDATRWSSIQKVSPFVWRWRQRQTLHYLRVLEGWYDRLDERGRLVPSPPPGSSRRAAVAAVD